MLILRWLLFIVILLLMVTWIFVLFVNHKDVGKDKAFYFAILFVLFIGAYYSYPMHSKPNSSSQEQVQQRPNLLGHKINRHSVKKDKDGFYYTDKTDKKIRYFTDDDGTITAVKCNFMPNPMGYTAVQNKLNGILNDDHVKYGNDKLDADETDLKGDNYNVYSPKHKKWYHMSMQKDDDGKVSTFSVWPGKVSNAE